MQSLGVITVVLAALAAVRAVSLFCPLCAGTVANQFMVTYSFLPDPLHTFSFYSMPRTTAAALKDSFTQVAKNKDTTTVWCRKGDFRVCVLFDVAGGVAGIQVSVRVSELKAPTKYSQIPEWRRQTFMGEDVYTATTYFVSKDVLAAGRSIGKNTLTAPDGLYFLQSDSNGQETGRLHVPLAQSSALSTGFTEQACFHGMGKHYFQGLSKTSSCEAHRPYFLLYGPKTKTIQGFGFSVYGKPSQGRGWYESPPALAIKAIAPNSPDCMLDWHSKYGLTTMHVFFVEQPYNTKCSLLI